MKLLPSLTVLRVCAFSCLHFHPAAAADAPEPPKADPQMQAVLDKLASLGGLPIETLDAKEARKQPTPADAVMILLKDQGKFKKEAVAKVEDISIAVTGSDLKGRVYVLPSP